MDARERSGHEAASCEVMLRMLEASGGTRLPYSHVDALTWATWLAVGSSQLERSSQAIRGLEGVKLTKGSRELIDGDIFRIESQIKRATVGSTRASERATEPGHTVVMDGWGPISEASPVDGSIYQFVACDEATGTPFLENVKRHRTQEYVTYIKWLQAHFAAVGRTLRRIRIDRIVKSINLDVDSLRSACAALGIELVITPADRHQGVGLPEVMNDILTRIGEAMIARAELTRRYILDARKYAAKLMQLRCPAIGEPRARAHWFYNRPVDVIRMVPYVWGCDVALINPETERGPKGGFGRKSEGILVGIEGSSYVGIEGSSRRMAAGFIGTLCGR